MKSKFCGKCGATNAEQMSFCLQCGQNLEVETVNQPNNQFGPNKQFEQPSPFAPNQPQPTFAAQNANPPVNNFPPANSGFPPFQQNFNSPNNFPPPNNPGFQPPAFQQMPVPQTAAAPQKGIGTKIFSGLGAVLVGLFFLLKGGFVLLRLGRLGGIGLVIAIVLIIAVIGIVSFVKKVKS
ncbi:MAG: hypothetical protein ABJA66_18625 [Actinomycetota bacterium]